MCVVKLWLLSANNQVRSINNKPFLFECLELLRIKAQNNQTMWHTLHKTLESNCNTDLLLVVFAYPPPPSLSLSLSFSHSLFSFLSFLNFYYILNFYIMLLISEKYTFGGLQGQSHKTGCLETQVTRQVRVY